MSDQIKAIAGPIDPEDVQLPTSSRKVIMLGMILVVLFFGVLGAWSAMATLQGAVIAHGEVIVETYRKQVQHREGGIIKEILVREGDFVQQDQVLIRLDGEREMAVRDLYRGQMDALLARQARLKAESERRARVSWPESLNERSHLSEINEIIQGEQKIFTSALAAKKSQKDLLLAQIQQTESQIRGQKRQLASISDTIESLREEISVKKPLLEGGYLDRSQIMELERTLNANRARRDELETQTAVAHERIQELRLRIDDLETQYVREAASRLGEVQQQILDLRERLRPAEDACRRLEITAPASGVVVDLNVRTEGGVIQGGAPLMEIVPYDSALIVSAMVAPHKIDDVRKGQAASVALSAFPTRYTSKVDGEVIYVSADRLESRQYNTGPYYLAYVRLDQQSLSEAIGDEARLTPGMPAEVYIQTEARTVFSYIMSPITESMRRTMRE